MPAQPLPDPCRARSFLAQHAPAGSAGLAQPRPGAEPEPQLSAHRLRRHGLRLRTAGYEHRPALLPGTAAVPHAKPGAHHLHRGRHGRGDERPVAGDRRSDPPVGPDQGVGGVRHAHPAPPPMAPPPVQADVAVAPALAGGTIPQLYGLAADIDLTASPPRIRPRAQPGVAVGGQTALLAGVGFDRPNATDVYLGLPGSTPWRVTSPWRRRRLSRRSHRTCSSWTCPGPMPRRAPLRPSPGRHPRAGGLSAEPRRRRRADPRHRHPLRHRGQDRRPAGAGGARA